MPPEMMRKLRAAGPQGAQKMLQDMMGGGGGAGAPGGAAGPGGMDMGAMMRNMMGGAGGGPGGGGMPDMAQMQGKLSDPLSDPQGHGFTNWTG